MPIKRKATLDAHVQADARTAFRRLRLQINQLERDRRHHPQDIDRYIATPVGLDVLLTQAQRLRRELEYWSNLVSGHHPVRLIDISIRLHNKLSVIESDLEWDQQALVSKFDPKASDYVAN
jgi:hypothetical protein